MRLPKLAIQNYNFTIVLFILLLIIGLSSFLNMPRMENPAIYIPGASVTVIYPGASPNDLEKLVAMPIEEALNEIDDIDRINTTIIDGITSVMVRFDFDTDAKEKYDEVVSKVNSIKGDLPAQIFDIITSRWTSTDVQILQYALVSEQLSYYELHEYADNLKKKIEKSYGVKKVEIHAIPDRQVRISIDLEKMAMMNIGLNQVMDAMQSYNANIPGGAIDVAGKTFNIKTSGPYETLDDIRNTVIQSYQGKIIYLKNIADVDYKDEDIKYMARFKGNRAAFVTVMQKDDINIFKIMEGINPLVEEYKSNLENNVELYSVFDQSQTVDDRISSFLSNLIQGIILVGLLILLSLGLRSSIIIIIAIPLSILIGLAVVDFSGYGLEQISIAGLVIALGLLVDNSIVMIENITRHIKMGYKPKEAAHLGASEIGWPIVSATLTTVLAFIPIIMMKNEAGDFIRSLPITIIATLTVSLIIALTLSPLVASLVIKNDFNNEKVHHNFKFSDWLKRFIEGPYRKTLKFSLQNKVLVVLISFVLLAFSVFVFIKKVPQSLFPKAETPQMLIRINLPEGSNLKKTDEVSLWVESVLDTMPEIKHYASNVGKGNPRIYYNVFQRNYAKNFAEIYVELYEYEVESFSEMVSSLRDVFKSYIGAEISIKELEQGNPVAAAIEIHILGDEISVLREISKNVEEFIKSTPGVINVENELDKTQTDLFVKINKDKAIMLGVPIHEIDRTIRTAITGWPVSTFLDQTGEEHDMVVRLSTDEEIKLSDFNKIYVKSVTGRFIPLNLLADIEFREAPGIISRYNLVRNARVLGDLERGANLDEVMMPILEMLEEYPFPEAYHYKIGGELESREDSFGGMQIALIITIISILAVLILQFNSFLQPLIIFVTVPLAFIGMIWALYLTGNSFSFTAFIGLIALVGIVVNNSIILVDYTNVLRSKGTPLYEAVQIAGETRFTPIILTAFTTIGGLLPLTLRGGTLWAPMGWTIIGGLLVSTMLTLVIVPVIYAGLERFLQIVGKKK